MTVDVRDKKQLEKLVSAMRRISGVRDVEDASSTEMPFSPTLNTSPFPSRRESRLIGRRHRSEYGLRTCGKVPLRECTGAHGTPPRQPEAENPFQMFKPALKMLGVEPVGNYAIRINWSDGHNAGIYSYEHFRRDLRCEELSSGHKKVT